MNWLINIPSGFTLLTALVIIGLSGCSQPGTGQQAASAGKAKKVKVAVGEVKEVKFVSPKDTTLQIVSSSENKEVVDVSNQELEQEGTAPAQTGKKRTETFLIKGITPGSVRVTFADKRTGEEGPGRIRRAYLVEVITK